VEGIPRRAQQLPPFFYKRASSSRSRNRLKQRRIGPMRLRVQLAYSPQSGRQADLIRSTVQDFSIQPPHLDGVINANNNHVQLGGSSAARIRLTNSGSRNGFVI